MGQEKVKKTQPLTTFLEATAVDNYLDVLYLHPVPGRDYPYFQLVMKPDPKLSVKSWDVIRLSVEPVQFLQIQNQFKW